MADVGGVSAAGGSVGAAGGSVGAAGSSAGSANASSSFGPGASAGAASSQASATGSIGSAASAQTSIDALASNPTAADSLSTTSSLTDSIVSESTLAESIAAQATATSALASEPTTSEQLTGGATATASTLTADVGGFLAKDHNADISIYSNQDKSVNVGRVKADYTAPNAGIETEKLKASASVGVSGEITVADAQTKLGIGADLASVTGKTTVGTINGHLTGEAKGEFNGLKSNLTLSGSAGAEAMAIDARIGGEISITPKTVGDTLGGLYNSYVDPVVDYMAGRDVAGIPAVPDSFDHGVAIAGHVEGGYGASAKIGGAAELGNGKGAKIGGNFKVGLGPVFGAGLTFGVK